MRYQQTNKPSHGFTLIELITVIVVLGIVSVGVAGFLRSGLQIYNDANERDQLLSQSRFVIERVSRELRAAIPNSVRLQYSASAGTQCLEFVPALWASYYTTLPVIPSTATLARVVELADNANQYAWQAGDSTFVYPTSNQDVYASNSLKRQTILACSDDMDADEDGNPDGDGDCNTADSTSHIAELEISGAFADSSPASRMYFARNTVSFCARNGSIFRYQDNINNNQTLYQVGGDLLGQNLHNNLTLSNELPFRISGPTLNRSALIQLRLAFELQGEIVNYNTEVHIPNVP